MHSVYRVVRGDFDRQALQAQKMAENRRRKKCLRVVTILSILITVAYRIGMAFI